MNVPKYCCEVEPENMPDMVAVVRCKNCRFMKPSECYVRNRMGNQTETRYFCYGKLHGEIVSPEFYCADGKSKDGDDDEASSSD